MNSSERWSGRLKAIVFGFGIALAVQTSGNWFRILIDRVPDCGQPNCVADFAAIYTGGQLMRENPRLLYDADAQLDYQKKVAPGERALPFLYPPITAAILAPLSVFSFSSAFLLVTFINLWLLGASLRLWIRSLGLTKDQGQWLALFTLCNFGVHAVVFYGQTSALLLFLLTRHILAQKKSSGFTRGLWAGLLCLKPQFLVIPCSVLGARRDWRTFLIASGTALLLVGGTFVWIGGEATHAYLGLARKITFETDWTNPVRSMHSFKALEAAWLPAWQPYVAWSGSFLVITTVIYLNRFTRRQPNDFAISWITNSLALLIMSPHLFTHDLTLLIIPWALFLSLSKERVPTSVGLAGVTIAALPALNYVLPTSTAIVLLLLFLLSVKLNFVKTAWSDFSFSGTNAE